MSTIRLLGALSRNSKNYTHFSYKYNVRHVSSIDLKHFKLKVVDNVGVVTVDSPGVKTRLRFSTWRQVASKVEEVASLEANFPVQTCNTLRVNPKAWQVAEENCEK
ncbi:hypothetical protein JTB14_017188 [Gonioctena quinquepunctata]|nr:hypothetical protein JTB14_017188 [Gonioctena quinquepunctata]